MSIWGTYTTAGQGSTAPLSGTTAARAARRSRKRIATLRLVREGSFTAPAGYPDAGTPVRSPRDVFQLMQPFADREVGESFWILALDSQHRVSGPTVITRGILNASLVHPREVFQAAILAGAAAVVLVHNHPSGDPTPSADDRMVTDQLVAAGRLLDIPVHDHVIVGRKRYTSFAEAGLL
jgi:DNA repair protein RadC